MNNKTGRPRNTSGSLYRRRDSRVWWMSYRDHDGKFRQESTGRKEKGEAEKVMRNGVVLRGERQRGGVHGHDRRVAAAHLYCDVLCRLAEQPYALSVGGAVLVGGHGAVEHAYGGLCKPRCRLQDHGGKDGKKPAERSPRTAPSASPSKADGATGRAARVASALCSLLSALCS